MERDEHAISKLISDCWTALTVVVTPRSGGAAIKRSGNTLSIFKKKNDQWLLFRDANMLSVVQE